MTGNQTIAAAYFPAILNAAATAEGAGAVRLAGERLGDSINELRRAVAETAEQAKKQEMETHQLNQRVWWLAFATACLTGIQALGAIAEIYKTFLGPPR